MAGIFCKWTYLYVIKDLMQCNPQNGCYVIDSSKNEWMSNRRVKGFTQVNSVINNWWLSFSRFDLFDIWYMNCHLCFKGWMVQSAENGRSPGYKNDTKNINFLKTLLLEVKHAKFCCLTISDVCHSDVFNCKIVNVSFMWFHWFHWTQPIPTTECNEQLLGV